MATAEGQERGDLATRFAPGNQLSVRHGVTSEARIRPVARNHRRKILRQLRIRSGDLDALGRGYVDNYSRLQAKLDIADQWISEHGMLDATTGQPAPVMKIYVTLANSARLALCRLEDHLGRQSRSPEAALASYIDATYGDLDADES